MKLKDNVKKATSRSDVERLFTNGYDDLVFRAAHDSTKATRAWMTNAKKI